MLCLVAGVIDDHNLNTRICLVQNALEGALQHLRPIVRGDDDRHQRPLIRPGERLSPLASLLLSASALCLTNRQVLVVLLLLPLRV